MTVPDFQSIMLPLLQLASDGQEHSVHEYVAKLAIHFNLSEQDINEMLPIGKQTTFYNRVGWARIYLAKSGLLEMPRRSYYRITERGRQVPLRVQRSRARLQGRDQGAGERVCRPRHSRRLERVGPPLDRQRADDHPRNQCRPRRRD